MVLVLTAGLGTGVGLVAQDKPKPAAGEKPAVANAPAVAPQEKSPTEEAKKREQ
jgi:hypothetical protein